MKSLPPMLWKRKSITICEKNLLIMLVQALTTLHHIAKTDAMNVLMGEGGADMVAVAKDSILTEKGERTMNDDLYKITCNIQAKIAEKQEKVIMQTIQEIGGDKFCEITFDRNKVIEALTMYKNKDKYAEVVHGEWIYDYSGECVPGTDAPLCQKCSECGEYTVNEENFCPNCGAKMDAKNDFKE